MANFFFIHGAMHGAWCWVKVIDILVNNGHHCLDMDLPGAGLDRTPRTEVTFDTYLQSIDHFIENNDLHNVNLVGHSMAGMLLPNIAVDERAGISNIIFLAAYVLDKGESVIGIMPEERRKVVLDAVNASEDNTYLPTFEYARKSYFNDLDDEAAENYYKLMTPQPHAPVEHVSDADLVLIEQPMHYINCTRDQAVNNELAKKFISKINCDVHEIDGGHDSMLSHPHELAELLEKIAL